MAPSEQPQILLLCLSFQSFLDQQYASLIDRISQSAQLKRSKTVSGAIRYLDSNTPKAIIATDEGLAKPENAAFIPRLLSYLQNGGVVIFGLHFPNFVTDVMFENLFKGSFDLAWKRGDYQRGTFEVNDFYTLPRGVAPSSLPSAYSMKALHVRDAKPQERILVPVAGSKTQSMVFAPSDVDRSQAAVVGARIGNGYLAYVGDVNGEEESDDVILVLCGL
ncbi:uncharacterized protein RCO7_05669 [Rhynchosporium graminicola]|uniref:Uncharacterized protein n=1 Tax=Rhynchosporium graminicola TaxID=2792576 RepID=A0A1E1L0S1_9HELO|nr:uncharacterized protein RCO7_05669 [Rhynchosporium commune]